MSQVQARRIGLVACVLGVATLLPVSVPAAPSAVQVLTAGEAQRVASGRGKTRESTGKASMHRLAGSSPEALAGWAFIRQGAYLKGNLAFVQAARQTPQDPSVLVGLGYSYLLLADYDRARQALERAIHLDITSAFAHRLLGDLYLRQGELERAIHHYGMARKQEPGDWEAQRRLQMARHRYGAELQFDRLYSAHFVIKYRGSTTDSAVVHDLADRLEQVYDRVGGRFDFFPSHAFTVILYPSRDFWKATETPRWAGGLFDGNIHLPTRIPGTDLALSNRSLRHEYTHALVDYMSAGRAPLWLSEGLAQYFERGAKTARPSPSAPSLGRQRMLDAAGREWIGLPAEAAQAAYADSYRATSRLIDRYGLVGIRRLLTTLSTTSDFPTAFESVFQTSYRTFEVDQGVSPTRKRF